MLLRMRVVNKEGRFISVGAALLRDIFGILSGVLSYLSRAHVFATLPASEIPQRFAEISQLVRTYGGIWPTIRLVFGVVVYADLFVILLNRKKRALHDFIAGSYVVTKRSYESKRRPPGEPAKESRVADQL